jgi:cellulose synthase/poly-beta-1,6-N-acetylglucosamine synthase-like glycosyltransferase
MTLLILSATVGIAYGLLQGYYLLHWRTLKPAPRASPDLPGVSVIIAARNEAAHIRACLDSLLAQDYPADKMEIVVIDDHSTDATFALAAQIADPRVRIIRLPDYPDYIRMPATKKSAITLGVDQAAHDLLLITDADTIPGPGWISAHVRCRRAANTVFQTGPVLIGNATSMIECMQAIEYHALMTVTGAGLASGLHDLANGANMAFTRQAFRSVGGYAGNFEYASGDDLFLAEKMRQAFPSGLAFVKEPQAIVRTEAMRTWPDLFAQRKRWAGKNSALRNPWIGRLWLFVGAVHLALAALLTTGLLGVTSIVPFLVLATCKIGADALLLREGIRFSGDMPLWRRFLPAQALYWAYVLAMGVWLLSRIGKDRKV